MFTRYLHQLKNIPLFENMSSNDITAVLSHLPVSLHTYEKDACICLQDEPFFMLGILLEGKLQSSKTYLTNDNMILGVTSAPDVFCDDIICAGCPSMPYSIHAIQDTVLLLIDGHSVFSMNKQSSSYMSQFLINIIRLVGKRSISASTQVDYSRITSLRKRVAIFLLNQYQETGQLIFSIPLSRYEMANYLSVTRPALSKVLAELKKESIIDYYKDSFKIENLDKLINL